MPDGMRHQHSNFKCDLSILGTTKGTTKESTKERTTEGTKGTTRTPGTSHGSSVGTTEHHEGTTHGTEGKTTGKEVTTEGTKGTTGTPGTSHGTSIGTTEHHEGSTPGTEGKTTGKEGTTVAPTGTPSTSKGTVGTTKETSSTIGTTPLVVKETTTKKFCEVMEYIGTLVDHNAVSTTPEKVANTKDFISKGVDFNEEHPIVEIDMPNGGAIVNDVKLSSTNVNEIIVEFTTTIGSETTVQGSPTHLPTADFPTVTVKKIVIKVISTIDNQAPKDVTLSVIACAPDLTTTVSQGKAICYKVEYKFSIVQKNAYSKRKNVFPGTNEFSLPFCLHTTIEDLYICRYVDIDIYRGM